MNKETLTKLLAVQAKLKAPKGQKNSFGNYNYRSCEDILEAVKPLLAEQGLTCMIADEIVMIGDRFYVKATVFLNGEPVGSALAREQETKKGMDPSQVTGSCSSYARKYALNGVFLIDDTRDADSQDNSSEGAKTPAKKVAKKVAPPADRNAGVTKWQEWKSPKGTTLKVFADSKMDEQKKFDLLEEMKAKIEKDMCAATVETEGARLDRDLKCINDCIDNLVVSGGGEEF